MNRFTVLIFHLLLLAGICLLYRDSPFRKEKKINTPVAGEITEIFSRLVEARYCIDKLSISESPEKAIAEAISQSYNNVNPNLSPVSKSQEIFESSVQRIDKIETALCEPGTLHPDVRTEPEVSHLKTHGAFTLSPHNALDYLFVEQARKIKFEDGTPWIYSDHVSGKRFKMILGGMVSMDLLGFFKLADIWYRTDDKNFKFYNLREDSREFRQMDKIGHTMDAYFMSYSASKLYRWSGFSARKSVLYGSLTGFLWMLQIEVSDGFFWPNGFSFLDLTANTVGAGFAAMQQLYPKKLRPFRLKISYTPSQVYHENRSRGGRMSMVDDYEGMTFWLGCNIHDVMPERWRQGIPGWLAPFGMSIGYGADGILRNSQGGMREIYLGLDLDITKIPTGDSQLLNLLKDELNFVRLPLPAVKISPQTVWFGFYF